MHAWPDAPAIRAFLGRVTARLRANAALEGAAGGIVVAAVIAIADSRSTGDALIIAAVLAVAGAALSVVVVRERGVRAAAIVERRAPECRNVLITAAELLNGRGVVRDYVGSIVCRDAARAVAALDVATLFPRRRAGLALAGAIALWFLAARVGDAGSVLGAAAESRDAVVSSMDVSITPPSYTGLGERRVQNPTRIEAIAGSRLRVTAHSNADSVTIETVAGRHAMQATSARTFVADVTADADGYIALDAHAVRGGTGTRRLIGLSVTADAAPRVRVSIPARDLFVPDAHRGINVAIDASDDFGLGTLRLRYTKVSGSGEQFTFTDGDVPLTIARTDARSWTATAVLRLDSLGLGAGDMLVYRGVATDMRPTAPPAESDSYIVEITAPGAVAAEGYAVDDERDRYGLSQQMVILKTERLIAGRARMTPDSLAGEAMAIAAEQRAVRAEFVFMLGGEMAEEILAAESLTDLNEVADAKSEEDIAAGRLANRGRIDVVLAIRSMSQASTALNARDLDRAITQERSALKYLQAAFARTRYILRALSLRERLDASRRMTGALTGAVRDARPLVLGEVDARVRTLRAALADLAATAAKTELDERAAADVSGVAERLLRLDPASDALQGVARELNAAESSIRRGNRSAARARLDVAAVALSAVIRTELPVAARPERGLDVARLDGALTDALRGRPAGSGAASTGRR